MNRPKHLIWAALAFVLMIVGGLVATSQTEDRPLPTHTVAKTGVLTARQLEINAEAARLGVDKVHPVLDRQFWDDVNRLGPSAYIREAAVTPPTPATNAVPGVDPTRPEVLRADLDELTRRIDEQAKVIKVQPVLTRQVWDEVNRLKPSADIREAAVTPPIPATNAVPGVDPTRPEVLRADLDELTRRFEEHLKGHVIIVQWPTNLTFSSEVKVRKE